MFAICDGHGEQGHHVSNFLKVQLPMNLSRSLPIFITQNNETELV